MKSKANSKPTKVVSFSVESPNQFAALADPLVDQPEPETVAPLKKQDNHPRVKNPKPKKTCRLARNSRKFFVKIDFGSGFYFALLDSGSEVTIVPKRLLSSEQRSSILPTRTVVTTYTDDKVDLIGECKLDLVLEGGTIRDQLVLVTGDSCTPVIGTDCFFASGHQAFEINPESELVTFRGISSRVYSECRLRCKTIASVHRITSDSKQKARALEEVTVPAWSEAMVKCYLNLPPSSPEFVIDGGWVYNTLAVGKGLYLSDTFDQFPVRIANMTGKAYTIRKGRKLISADPLIDDTCPKATNQIKLNRQDPTDVFDIDEGTGVLRWNVSEWVKEGRDNTNSSGQIHRSHKNIEGNRAGVKAGVPDEGQMAVTDASMVYDDGFVGNCGTVTAHPLGGSTVAYPHGSVMAHPPSGNMDSGSERPVTVHSLGGSSSRVVGEAQSLAKSSSYPSPEQSQENNSTNLDSMFLQKGTHSDQIRREDTDPNQNFSGNDRNMTHESPVGARSLFSVNRVIDGVSPRPKSKTFRPDLARQGIMDLDPPTENKDDRASSETDETRFQAVWSQITVGTQDPKYVKEAEAIVREYLPQFLLGDELPRESKLPKFKVYPKTDAPIASQNYRVCYAKKPALRAIISKNLRQGLIKRTCSAWNSPILLVPKKDGTERMVIDYRAINRHIVQDHYPLPRIEDLCVNLKKAKSYTTMDLGMGFHQVGMEPESAKILAFGSDIGQFELQRMPMGISTAPAYLQREMDKCFVHVPVDRQLVYIDDIFIHSPTHEGNLKQFRETMSILAKHDLQVKASKTCLLLNKALFCGHVIENGTMGPSEDRIQGLLDLGVPRTKRQAQSIFGKFNYLRQCIPGFAKIGQHITRCYSGPRFKWTPKAQEALDQLKRIVSESTMKRAIPDPINDHLVVETDASDECMGAVLYVCEGKKSASHEHSHLCLKPVEFFSKCFSESQRLKKHTREKELLAFKHAINRWRMYLLGRFFIWWTDSESMKYAHSLKSSKERFAKHLAELSEYDYEVQIKRTHEMKVSDCLSRPMGKMTAPKAVNSLKMTMSDMKKEQDTDPILHKISSFVHIDRWPNQIKEDELAFWRRKRSDLVFGKGGELLLRSADKPQQLLVPEHMRKGLLQAYHDDSFHPGAKNTQVALEKSFVWYGLADDVRDYIQKCMHCQKTKPNLRPQKPPMARTTLPNGPYQYLAIDLTGPFQVTDNDNRYILVCCDHFSKKVSARAIPSKHPTVIVQHFREIICDNPRMPHTLLSDNGTEFQGAFSLYLQTNKIKHVHSAPYRPQTNGLVERMNQTLKSRLRPHDNPQWDEELPVVVQLINQTPNEHTKFSPFEVERATSGDNPNNPTCHSSASRLLDLPAVQDQVFQRQMVEKSRRAAENDRPGFKPYQQGSLVLMKARSGPDRFTGPLQVLEVFADGASYKLSDLETQAVYVRRSEELKPFIEPDETDSDSDATSDHSSSDNPPPVSHPAPVVLPPEAPVPVYRIPQRRQTEDQSDLRPSDRPVEPEAVPEPASNHVVREKPLVSGMTDEAFNRLFPASSSEEGSISSDDPSVSCPRPSFESSPRPRDPIQLADQLFGVASEGDYNPDDFESTIVSDSESVVGSPVMIPPIFSEIPRPCLPDLPLLSSDMRPPSSPIRDSPVTSSPVLAPARLNLEISTGSIEQVPIGPSTTRKRGADQAPQSPHSKVPRTSPEASKSSSSDSSTMSVDSVIASDYISRSLTGGIHTRFEGGNKHVRLDNSSSSSGRDDEILNVTLNQEEPMDHDPCPADAPPSPEIENDAAASSSDSRKRSRSEPEVDPFKKPRLVPPTTDRAPSETAGSSLNPPFNSPIEILEPESAAETTMSDSTADWDDSNWSTLETTLEEEHCPRGYLTDPEKLEKMRSYVQSRSGFLHKFADRLDLVRKEFKAPADFDLLDLLEHIRDKYPTVIFRKSHYKKEPQIDKWPKIALEETYSRKMSKPLGVDTELGVSYSTSRQSYFQLMRLAIDFQIYVTESDSESYDKLRKRVENWAKTSDSVVTWADPDHLGSVCFSKTPGDASFNTNGQSLAGNISMVSK